MHRFFERSAMARRPTALARMILIVLLATGESAMGQSEADRILNPADKSDIIEVQLDAVPGLNDGKIVMYRGTAFPIGSRYSISNLSIMAPVVVALVASVPDDDIRLEVREFDFSKPVQTLSTKGKGFVITTFRNEGEAHLQVTAQEPSLYRLLVWVGNPRETELEPVTHKMSDAEAKRAALGGGVESDTPLVLWIIAGLLAAILLALGIALFARRKQK